MNSFQTDAVSIKFKYYFTLCCLAPYVVDSFLEKCKNVNFNLIFLGKQRLIPMKDDENDTDMISNDKFGK